MKPFDLQEALAGAKVVTRLGIPATHIVHYAEVTGAYCIGAVVNGELLTFTKNGRIWDDNSKDSDDLFMVTTKKKGWINIYPQTFPLEGTIARAENVFVTKEGADRLGKGRIACIEIEWEE